MPRTPRPRPGPCSRCWKRTSEIAKLNVCWECFRELARGCPPISRERLRKYSLDSLEFGYFYVRQHGRCAICGVDAPLVIDHDHETGLVRGLLCGRCNSGLGFFRDNSASLREAIKYLGRAKTHNQTPPAPRRRRCPEIAATRSPQDTDDVPA